MLFTVISSMESDEEEINYGIQIESKSYNSVLNDWVQSDGFINAGFNASDREEFYNERMYEDNGTSVSTLDNVWRNSLLINGTFACLFIVQSFKSHVVYEKKDKLLLVSYISFIVTAMNINQYEAITLKKADEMWLKDKNSWYTELSTDEFRKRKMEVWEPNINFTPIKGLTNVAKTTIYNEEGKGICFRILTDQS